MPLAVAGFLLSFVTTGWHHVTGTVTVTYLTFSTMSFIATHPTAISPALLPEEPEIGDFDLISTNEAFERPEPISLAPWQSYSNESSSLSITGIIPRPETPFIKRVSSVRLPDDKSNKTIEQLPLLLDLDLVHGQDGTVLNDVSDDNNYQIHGS